MNEKDYPTGRSPILYLFLRYPYFITIAWNHLSITIHEMLPLLSFYSYDIT